MTIVQKLFQTKCSGRLVALVVFSFLFLAPVIASSNTVSIPNPLAKTGATDLLSFIKLLFDTVIIPVGAIVVALAIIWSGFLFVTAQGNPAKIDQAKHAFFWSFIGGMVLLGSWTIAVAISRTIESIRSGS